MHTFMVIDVESIGIHGEGFSVGYVVIEEDGMELESAYMRTDPELARGTAEDHRWVETNVIPVSGAEVAVSSYSSWPEPKIVRHSFWQAWMKWKTQGAILAADCGWPVEARFLIACVEDLPEHRKWAGPYPFLEISSVRLAAGLDPIATVPRLSTENPPHHPLADARQSARLLVEALKTIRRNSI